MPGHVTKIMWMMLYTLLLAHAETACLSNAIPEGKRTNITVGGVNMAIGIVDLSWTSANWVTQVYRILVKEVLGYNTASAITASTGAIAAFAIAGCSKPKKYATPLEAGCESTKPPRAHFAGELWPLAGRSAFTSLRSVVSEKRYPEDVGPNGFLGAEALYVLGPSVAPALKEKGLALEYYKSYNASWFEPWKYFSKVSDIPTEKLKTCEKSGQAELAEIKNYVKWSGDKGSAEYKDGKITAGICWDSGKWWRSPACRAKPETCIPVITGGTAWGAEWIMAQTSLNGIPVSIATAATWALYLSIPRDYKVLLYWWTPETTFIDLIPEKVGFPAFNGLEWAAGNYRTAKETEVLAKWVLPTLHSNAPRAYDLAKKMSIPQVTIDAVLLDIKKSGDKVPAAACKWIKANPTLWKPWIPVVTNCIAGQGLTLANGNFVKNRSVAAGCGWCQPGSYSAPLAKDTLGLTYKCELCGAGKSQKIPGQKECSPCETGYYTDTKGRSFCTKCPVATYANNVSASQCTPCGGVLTTLDTAVSDPNECVCPKNMYRTMGNKCEACPAGMACAAGSFVGKLAAYESKQDDTNRAREPEKAPEVLKGFYSKKDKPLSVYECKPSESCPGIVPTNCAGKRKGFMCTDCPKDHITNGDLEDDETASGCSKCESFKLFQVIIFPFVALIALFAILWDTRHSPLNDGPLQVEIMQVGGQLIMFMQILGAMQAASLRYGEPFTSFTTAIIAPIDMDQIFSATPCIYFGFMDAATAFLTTILLPAIFAVLLIIVFFISNWIRKDTFVGEGLLNAIGEVLIEFYVSITIAVMAPFKCYKHPNGEASMVFRPEVLCGEGKHISMQVFAIIGLLLYPINCFCTTCIAVHRHPKCMAKNDIGILIRCHFLFNRWNPKSYWFAVVAVSRNFFVALWPMILPQEQMDFAVSLMVSTLLAAVLWACWEKPRRTPAMNKLDIWISFVQVVILAVGSMSIYRDDAEVGIKSQGLSTLLIILTISVFFVGAIIAVIKAMQLLSKGRTPFSWAFDVFIDFHGGIGANGIRTLQLILASVVKKDKVFYDYDSYLKDGYLGVIADAVKLSQNCIVVLGTETWCRSWCVVAICGAVSKKIPMQTITLEGAPFEVVTTDERVLKMLSQQVPRTALRPMGVRDQSIPEAISAVFSLKPGNFDMSSLDAAKPFVDALLGNLKNVRPGTKTTGWMTEFFCKSSMLAVESPSKQKWYGEDGVNAPSGGVRVLSKLYTLLSCDHTDPEGIAVSRLMYMSLKESLRTCQDAGTKTALMEIGIIEDVDLDAAEFDDLVTNKRIPVVVTLFTDTTLSSQPQLFRLGHIHKFTSPRTKVVPVAIRDTLNVPSRKVLDDIEIGGMLKDTTTAKASVHHTTKVVSMDRVISAVMECLEAVVCLVDVPKLSGKKLTVCVDKVLVRIGCAAQDYKQSPEVDGQDDTKGLSIFGSERRSERDSRCSTKEGQPPEGLKTNQAMIEVSV